MRVILTGATGTAGSAALEVCLRDPRVEQVTVVGRRSPDRADPKLKSLVLSDFLDWSKLGPELADHDACLWCLGISQSQVDEAEYRVITVDYTLAAARALMAANPKLVFCFLSGQGADTKEQSWMLFGRVKGHAENELLKLGLPVYCFRPGYIHGQAPGRTLRFQERLGRAFVPLLKRTRSMMVDAEELGRAMLHVARHGAAQPILENADILGIAETNLAP